MKSLFLALVFSVSLIGCGSAYKKVDPQPATPTSLQQAVSATYRSPEMTVRDQYRHPLETLTFFGVSPQMTVVEISPAAGWYTQILAPYLNANGQYIAAQVPNEAGEFMQKLNNQRNAWAKAHAELTSKMKTVDLDFSKEYVPAGTADMVLTFRNVHNWMADDAAQAAFNSFFKALKPGGILGVVEHRAFAKSKKDANAKSGYVLEKDVLKFAKKAGFKLIAKSEVNANPKDTKDYPEGVWTLPPTLRLKDKDREKYLAIGESDRMTLKFIKPIK